MRQHQRFLLLVGLHLLFWGSGLAQNAPAPAQDTSNIPLLKAYQAKLHDIEQKRLQDSLQRIRLEEQLQHIKTSDQIQKKELQAKLDELKARQAKHLLEKKAKIDSLRATAKSFPVVGGLKDTLFFIYHKVGSLSPSERAKAVSQRIRYLMDDPAFSQNSIQLVAEESSVDLVTGETILISISEYDALWNNTDKLKLAEAYKHHITQAVLNYRQATRFSTLIKEIAGAIAVLLALIVTLFGISRLSKWTAKKIKQQEGKRLAGLKIKDYTLFDTNRQIRLFLFINTVLKWILFLLLVYIALPIIFGFFPWTQDVARTLFGYVLDPLKKILRGIWHYLPNLFTILVIFLVFHYTIRGLRFLKQEIESGKLHLPGFYPDWANPTFQILRVILYAFMFVLIFPYLPGSDSPVFQGVSVFLGFLFTFGSAGSLSNVIAGIVLTYMRLFKLGDRVKIGEVTGDVIEKSMLVTRVKTIKNEIVSIPNSTVMSSHTINYSNEAEQGLGLIIHTTVTIGYDVPWKDMHQALLQAADRTELLLKDPKPFVLQTSLDDFYVSYQINAYTKSPQRQSHIYSELHQNIQDCSNEAGIEIMSPHYRAARDGNTTTIPADYLSKEYKSPSFQVKVEKEKEDEGA